MSVGTRNQRLVLLLHHGGPSGTVFSHIEWLAALHRLGFSTTTISPKADDFVKNHIEAQGGAFVELVQIPWWARPDSTRSAAADRLAQDAYLDVLRTIRWVNPHAVVTQSGVTPLGALAAHELGIPHIWVLREYGYKDHGLVYPFKDAVMGEIFQQMSAHIVTNSVEVAEHFGIHQEVLTVIRPNPKTSEKQEFTHQGKAREEIFTIGVVGSIQPGKGIREALLAFANYQSFDDNSQLVLYGTGSASHWERIIGIRRDLKLEHSVIFAGVRHANECFTEIDVLLALSHNEAFGRTPMEAAQYGVPTVYAKSGGYAGQLIHEVNALGVDAADPTSVAAALLRLNADKQLGLLLARELTRSSANNDTENAIGIAIEKAIRDYCVPKASNASDEILRIVLKKVLDHDRSSAALEFELPESEEAIVAKAELKRVIERLQRIEARRSVQFVLKLAKAFRPLYRIARAVRS